MLYAYTFNPAGSHDKIIMPIIRHLGKIDQKIALAAPEWPIAKINRIDLAILRLAAYEFTFGQEPVKVIIDEAVELAKQYGSEKSPQFINGALGAMVKNA